MSPEVLALSVVILIFSVVVHEVMHGLVALKYGDDTAQNAGRLTLNPIPHIDPIGSLLIPFIAILSGLPFIAAAKPVPVNPLKFSKIKEGEIAVSLAGILSNLGLALIGVILYHLVSNIGSNVLILSLLQFFVTINLALAVFNLLPIPPLDGSKVLLALLPYKFAKQYQDLFLSFPLAGIIFLLILLYFGILGLILSPVFYFQYQILGVPPRFF